MEHTTLFRIMVLLIGGLTSGYLVYLFLYKHLMPLLALVGASLLAWFSGQFLLTGIQSVFGTVSPPLRLSLLVFAGAGMLLDSPFLLHAMVRNMRDQFEINLPGWVEPTIYVPCMIPLIPALVLNDSFEASLLHDTITLQTFLGVKATYILLISAVSWWFSRLTQHRDIRYFTARFPLFLLASLVLSTGIAFYTGGEEASVLTTLSYGAPLLPMLFFLWTVHRYQLLSVEITERTVFSFAAVCTIFLYFYVIRHVGSRLERVYDINPEALEIVLFLFVIVLLIIAGRWTMKLTGSRRRRNSYRVLDALADRLSSSEVDREQGIELVAGKLQEAFDAPVDVIRDESNPLFNHVRDRPEQPVTVLDGDRPELVRKLRDREGHMLVPLSDENRVLALVIIGSRRHYLSFTPGEREVVSLVMRQFREAVKNHDLIREQLALERKVQQDEKLEALGNVAASCAHEVKNPLSSINGIISNMKEELEENDQHLRDVDVIQEEIDRLDTVVHRILDFARKGEDRIKRINVNQLVDGIAYVLRKSPEGIRLETILPDEPVYVRAVESDLKGILFNVLRNAIEASPRGETVRIDVSREQAQVIIDVTNRGPSPDREVVDLIRGHPSSGTIGQRDRLGLSIVLDQLEAMDGSLEVDPGGETTTFTVYLAVAGDDEDNDIQSE